MWQSEVILRGRKHRPGASVRLEPLAQPMTSVPFIYGLRTSGTVTVPSLFW